jgi:hypothetical protein
MKRMMMMVALAAFLVAALSVSALSAFASNDGTCTNNGCKDKGTAEELNSGSPSGKDKDPQTPFSTETTTTTQNNSEKNPNKVTTSECVLLPNGDPKPGQDASCYS